MNPDPRAHGLLARAAEHAEHYLTGIRDRHAGPMLSGEALRGMLRCPLPDAGEDPQGVLDLLAGAGLEGTAATQGPRYFGFVNGGSLPVATAADWLVSAWDQNAQVFVMSPLASVVEDVAAGWLKELFGLPATWSVGFVTGAQMATFTGLLAARHHLLYRAGWDVERDGLFGAPPIDIVVSEESHRTIVTAVRMLGLGEARIRRVETDEQGRMRPDLLATALAGPGCTSMRRSACGPWPVPPIARSSPESTVPIRSRRMATSGSTSRTIRGSCSRRIPRRTVAR